MFVLKNKYGNVYKKVNTERERDELLKGGYTLVEDKVDLDKMKVEDLEAYAAENGIDLSGCGNKTEKLAKIKESIKE
ncbi:MAG: hypothetical protein IJD45_01160 [Clostridia bacterium]|nr:hypothetical protein [Clostridia bacterium]